ncbi:electron transfer flavoprotein subunit beta/FixA family protein [bacterium]|nr:electron transfer flavoprotein subunit beta/FixA family protein [bacterium]
MNIAVCVKQVPDTADIKWTENNTIQREGLESIINPFDMYAIETALRLKDKFQSVNITALTMGPPQAEEIIRKAISLGIDKGFVITDKKFAGADTAATGRTLAAAIDRKINDVDLILCGQLATDGDTAQTGPSISVNLNYPVVTYVKEISSFEKDYITVKKEVEDGLETLKVKLPAVLCMLKCDYEPRRPLIEGFKRAQNADIPKYGLDNIGLQPENVGIKGSPTCVSKAFRPETKQGGEIIEPKNIAEAVNKIMEALNG